MFEKKEFDKTLTNSPNGPYVTGSLSFAGQWQDGETTSGAGCPCSATRGVSCGADTIATGAVCG